jgi:hypothetical protein
MHYKSAAADQGATGALRSLAMIGYTLLGVEMLPTIAAQLASKPAVAELACRWSPYLPDGWKADCCTRGHACKGALHSPWVC